MKNLFVLIILLSFGLTEMMSQTQNSQKNQVIVKKITIENRDGKEIRTETVDTFDKMNWKDDSSFDKGFDVIIENEAEGIEFIPGQGVEKSHEAPEGFEMTWFHKEGDEEGKQTPPNKAVLGVMLENVDGNNGAQISEVFKGSAAEKAGLQEGDIILSINKKETSNVDAVIESLSKNKVGDKVKIQILRETKLKNVKAILQERKEEKISKISCSPEHMNKMKKCSPEMMKKCTPEMMKECLKKCEGMGMNKKIRIKKEMSEIEGTGENNKKMIIINKNPGEMKIIRDGDNNTKEIEINKTRDGEKIQIESRIRNNDNQSLNVEYLSSSPNPSNGQMKIRFSGLEVPTTISVLDLNGKEIYNEKLNDFNGVYNKEIDIKNEARGTLILKIIQGDKIMTQKIIVE